MVDFSKSPVLVFWETTRACGLWCAHCRAAAIDEPLPGELTEREGLSLIDDIASFDAPRPTIIFTGGDPLRRRDLDMLMMHAKERGVPFAVSPAVTEALTPERLLSLKHEGAASVSISLDGASPSVHDSIRRRGGSFLETVCAIREAVRVGINVQVNTTVMKANLMDVPGIFSIVRDAGVKTWEVFFLVRVGRGAEVEDLSAEECESVCHFLFDASHYGVTVRCVEAPFIRRIMKERLAGVERARGSVYAALRSCLDSQLGYREASSLSQRGTLDGDGTIFVAYDGTICPGGLLPLPLGNVRSDSLARVYREDALLRRIRARDFSGPCGSCPFKDICGGSRARAYAYHGDPLASDPACLYASRGMHSTAASASS